MKTPIKIVACIGDPSSIGPQVAVDALSKMDRADHHRIVLVGSRSALKVFDSENLIETLESEKKLQVIDIQPDQKFTPAQGTAASGARALRDLEFAVRFLKEEGLSTLVTGPVDKFLCSQEQADFRGQTEFLKMLDGAESATMMLSGLHLRVALVTTHLPLREVSSHLSIEKIIETTERFWNYLKVFRNDLRLAVCALNPHASDRGLFGDEEEKIIQPAIEILRNRGLEVEGPLPADSLFYKASEYDGVVCMYHDQGLIPLKMNDFYEAVNITLGLGFLRISVDHGTAFDLVGSENVSSLSYQRALEQAFAWTERASKKD